jgi:hypothetical protein
MRRCWSVANKSVGGGRWCSARKAYWVGASQTGGWDGAKSAPSVRPLNTSRSGDAEIEALGETKARVQHGPARAQRTFAGTLAAGSASCPQHVDAFRKRCALVSQQEASAFFEQRFPQQQQPHDSAVAPEEIGLVRALGHRQTKWGTPAAAVVAAVSQMMAATDALRSLPILTSTVILRLFPRSVKAANVVEVRDDHPFRLERPVGLKLVSLSFPERLIDTDDRLLNPEGTS